eukprot:gb/GEZN01027179.1/.p1 GENE.gb/GEZN01027179.1/~~gb/GEZN01027179.1/.p1  ORF type:complete len:147 (-),score=13.41 gb/GEZN01027179.1/:2-442(-)
MRWTPWFLMLTAEILCTDFPEGKSAAPVQTKISQPSLETTGYTPPRSEGGGVASRLYFASSPDTEYGVPYNGGGGYGMNTFYAGGNPVTFSDYDVYQTQGAAYMYRNNNYGGNSYGGGGSASGYNNNHYNNNQFQQNSNSDPASIR